MRRPCDGGRVSAAAGAGRFEPLEPVEQRQRLFGRGAALDRRRQQPARGAGVAAVEGRAPVCSSSSPSRCRSAIALRARSM